MAGHVACVGKSKTAYRVLIGGACGMCGKEQDCIQGFDWWGMWHVWERARLHTGF